MTFPRSPRDLSPVLVWICYAVDQTSLTPGRSLSTR